MFNLTLLSKGSLIRKISLDHRDMDFFQNYGFEIIIDLKMVTKTSISELRVFLSIKGK